MSEIHIECGNGWRSLIDPLIERCVREGVAILQIKEKFGTLRFYTGPASPELNAEIDFAESASAHVCEDCGRPATKWTSYERKNRTGTWLKTLCDEHAKSRGYLA